MHDSRKVFLLDNEPRCIMASYDEMDSPKEFKTFDETIDVDDYVVVESTTRLNLTVCKVVSVDEEPNLDSNDVMRWVVSKIDMDVFNGVKNSEKKFLSMAKSAEKKRKKEQLKNDFLADVDNSIKILPSS